MKKSIGGIIGLVALICVIGYIHLANNVHDPFAIYTASYVTESAAPQLVGSSHKYTFRLTNVSDKTLKLDNVQLQGYSGIQVGEIDINGKPIGGQLIPSDRRGTATHWVTDGSHLVDYMVDIESKTIQNPQSVFITYSYLGFEHTQTVQLPGSLS